MTTYPGSCHCGAIKIALRLRQEARGDAHRPLRLLLLPPPRRAHHGRPRRLGRVPRRAAVTCRAIASGSASPTICCAPGAAPMSAPSCPTKAGTIGIVNVNSLDIRDTFDPAPPLHHYDGEDEARRRARRRKFWMPASVDRLTSRHGRSRNHRRRFHRRHRHRGHAGQGRHAHPPDNRRAGQGHDPGRRRRRRRRAEDALDRGKGRRRPVARRARSPAGGGCVRFFFKYCSTFDSTDAGNIGPVGDALIEALGARQAIYCPAFPENGRTIFFGHLFVGQLLLSDTHMRHHPLNPMTDSSLVRVLARQTPHKVGLVPLAEVQAGSRACAPRSTGSPPTACATSSSMPWPTPISGSSAKRSATTSGHRRLRRGARPARGISSAWPAGAQDQRRHAAHGRWRVRGSRRLVLRRDAWPDRRLQGAAPAPRHRRHLPRRAGRRPRRWLGRKKSSAKARSCCRPATRRRRSRHCRRGTESRNRATRSSRPWRRSPRDWSPPESATSSSQAVRPRARWSVRLTLRHCASDRRSIPACRGRLRSAPAAAAGAEVGQFRCARFLHQGVCQSYEHCRIRDARGDLRARRQARGARPLPRHIGQYQRAHRRRLADDADQFLAGRARSGAALQARPVGQARRWRCADQGGAAASRSVRRAARATAPSCICIPRTPSRSPASTRRATTAPRPPCRRSPPTS